MLSALCIVICFFPLIGFPSNEQKNVKPRQRPLKKTINEQTPGCTLPREIWSILVDNACRTGGGRRWVGLCLEPKCGRKLWTGRVPKAAPNSTSNRMVYFVHFATILVFSFALKIQFRAAELYFDLGQKSEYAQLKPWIYTTIHIGNIWAIHIFTPPLLKSDGQHSQRAKLRLSVPLLLEVVESGQGPSLEQI